MIGLSVREKAAYGLGAVGKDLVFSLVAGFLMFYYNTVLGISATFIGVLFMIARLFDAFNDPIMGVIVEKTHTRFGKFRPWILGGTIVNAFVLIGLFAVPKALTGGSLLVYASAMYILWGMTYTVMDIPFWSMIPAITRPGKERETVSVIGRSSAGVGYAVPVALTMVLTPILGGDDLRKGFTLFAAIISVFFILFLSVMVSQVRERHETADKSPTLKALFRAISQNDQALVVVVSIVIFNASLYLTQQLALYFFQFDLHNAALFGIFGTIGGAGQIIAMMLVPLLRKRLSRRNLLTTAICVTLFGYTLLFIIGSLDIPNMVLLSISAVIIFMGFGVATVLTTIFLADTVDYGEWKLGQRAESVVFSLQTFVVKLASAISVFIAGVGLDLIHLDVQATMQTPETLLGLRVLMIIVPMVGLVISLLFFLKRYRLSETLLDQMAQEVMEREAQK